MTKAQKQNTSRATRLTCRAPSAQAVFLAGAFNDWNPTAKPMAKDAEGNWSADLPLPPGRHEYKFVVDGEWCCVPGGDGPHHDCSQCVPNPFGTMNRVIDVV